MKNASTWVVIIGLIIFSGLASAVLFGGGDDGGGSSTSLGESLNPGFSLPTVDTTVDSVQISEALPGIGGAETNELVILAVLTVLFLGLIVGTGIAIMLLVRALDGTTKAVKDDEEYQSSMAEFTKREKEFVKQYVKEQPPTPIPSHERPTWAVISTSLIMALFLSFVGAAFSDNFLAGSAQFNWAVAFGAIGLFIGLISLNVNRIRATDAADSLAIPWGAIWVVATGVIIMGVGLGIMFWVRSQGGV